MTGVVVDAMSSHMPPVVEEDGAGTADLDNDDDDTLKVWHPEKLLLYIQSRDGSSVVCKQFNRNNAKAVVDIDSIRQIAAVTNAEIVWVTSDPAGTSRDAMVLFDDYIQTVLENGYTNWTSSKQQNRGPNASNTTPSTLKITRLNEANTLAVVGTFLIDFAQMTETNVATGDSNPILRRHVDEGAALPLSLLQIEEAVVSRSAVQHRTMGSVRVLYVHDKSANITDFSESQSETPWTTLVPLTDLFSLSVDLEAEDGRFAAPLDTSSSVALPLAARATDSSVTFIPEPLAEENVGTYLSDTQAAQWQSTSGANWEVYPPQIEERFNMLFGNLDALPQTPVLQLSTLNGPEKLDPNEALGVHLVSNRIDQSEFDVSRRASQKGKKSSLTPATVQMDDLSDNTRPALADHLCMLPLQGQIGYSDDTARAAADALARDLNKVYGLKMTVGKGSTPAQTCAINLVLSQNQMSPAMLQQMVTSPQGQTYYIDARMARDSLNAAPSCRITLYSPAIPGLELACATIVCSTGRAATNHATAVDAHAGAIAFPACYVMDMPHPTDLPPNSFDTRHVAIGVTGQFQNPRQFMEAANLTKVEPARMRYNTTRLVRRAVKHTREDGRLVVVKGQGLASLVAFNPNTRAVTVQNVGSLGSSSNDPIKCQLASMQLSSVFVPPAPRATGIDWNVATSAYETPNGKGCAYCFEFPEGIVVVRASDQPASELASHRVGRLLGVPMSKMVLLNTLSGEGQAIVLRLQHLSHSGKVKQSSGGSATTSAASLGASLFLAVQEYIPASSLFAICHAPGAANSWPAATFGPAGSLTPAGRVHLASVGKIIALDVLVHNNDRWSLDGIFDSATNSGNVSSIVFDSSSGGWLHVCAFSSSLTQCSVHVSGLFALTEFLCFLF